MAKTYLVTKTDFDSAIGVDDTAGLRGRIATNETAVGNETSGLVKKTNDIESSVGATAAEGLRKKTADLEATVGLDDTTGLRKDIIDVKADIGADDTTGLRKRSADLEAKVGTDDTKGLRKDNIDLKTKTAGFTYDDTAKRHTQVTSPTATAADEADLLTKKDGDALYGVSKTAMASSLGTAIVSSRSLFLELGGVKLLVGNMNTSALPVRIEFTNVGAVDWFDTSGGSGNITTTATNWTQRTDETPRLIDVYSRDGKYHIKIMFVVLNPGQPTQSLRCSAKITMA